MGDTTVKKIDSKTSPRGNEGQKYLASGKSLSMRLWQEEPCDKEKPPSKRDYVTVGYVLSGSAELSIEGQMVKLNAGDSWLVPKDAEHSYKILEAFTAVEATHPPAEVHGRDEAPDQCSDNKNECAEKEQAAGQKSSKGDSKCDVNKSEAAKSSEKCEVAQDSERKDDDADKQEVEDKTKKAQEIAAQIPRDKDQVTSNAEPRKAEPAERIKVDSKK